MSISDTYRQFAMLIVIDKAHTILVCYYLISFSVTGRVTLPCVICFFLFSNYIIVFLKSGYAGNNCCLESQLSLVYYIKKLRLYLKLFKSETLAQF